MVHRIIADCPSNPDSILKLANHFGLLTAASPKSEEPLDLWRQEIRFLRSLTVPKLAEKLSGVRFRLVPVEENGAVVLRYRATRFLDAIHQRFAEEFAALIQCAQCPAPNCGRWFLKSAGRGDSPLLLTSMQDASVSAERRYSERHLESIRYNAFSESA